MCQGLLKLAASAALLALPGLCVSAGARGIYVDREGQRHSWQITDANALIWDGRPYIPVGGQFCPRYFVEARTEENWRADVESLRQLKARGILDIYINPVRGATRIPTADWQRLIDVLEEEGFRYGIELTDGPDRPLTGWIVRPAVYRKPDITSAGNVILQTPGLQGGIAILANPKGDIVDVQALSVSGDTATIPVRGTEQDRRILLVYPLKSVDPARDGLQNFWEGYSEYRDRLIAHLKPLKLGAGFRFWVDPFINEMGLRREAEFLIPASRAYQVELEAWLRKRYADSSSLARAWGLQGEVTTFEQASRLIPLWRDRKGLTAVYDTASGKTIRLTTAESRMWEDLLSFRTHSIRGYLNSAAQVLKREIADVPVVVKWTSNYEFLINDDPSGFDGLGVEAYGSPSEIGPFAGAQCLALAKQSSRPVWLVATEIQTTSSERKEHRGFRSADELTACLIALKDAGAKGFFVFGLRLSPPWTNFDLLETPEQLDWLASFRDRLEMEPLLHEWSPRAVWFSFRNPLGADIRRLERDLWWLGGQMEAQEVYVEPGVRAFSLPDPEGEAVYIWVDGPPRSVEIHAPPGVEPAVHFTGPDERKVTRTKNTVRIPLTRDPAIVRGLAPSQFISRDALISQAEALAGLIRRAETQNVLVGQYRMALENAQAMIKGDRLMLARSTLARALEELQTLVAPFAWVEAEDAAEASFTATGYHPGASGTRYLKLDTPDAPPLAPYSASYAFFVPVEGDYQVWLAGSQLDSPETSPLSWNLDSSEWTRVGGISPTGNSYGPGFRWTRLGTARLAAGKHVIRIRAEAPAPATGQWSVTLDALLVTREAFAPDGARRPALR
ncbi:MAG: hypothetical protein KatS3mg024_0828 [Armatimonadota bacterium]|nr:MAG: hypothetical protein KatS3mg024_0828 [Armatimonadota bacterium]